MKTQEKREQYETNTILKNIELVFRGKNIEKLNKSTYDFLNLNCGFIAHYDIDRFKSYYRDLRKLIYKLDSANLSEVYENDTTGKAYIKWGIAVLLDKYRDEIVNYFEGKERKEIIDLVNYYIRDYNISLEELTAINEF